MQTYTYRKYFSPKMPDESIAALTLFMVFPRSKFGHILSETKLRIINGALGLRFFHLLDLGTLEESNDSLIDPGTQNRQTLPV